jgi:hypothetical protein
MVVLRAATRAAKGIEKTVVKCCKFCPVDRAGDKSPGRVAFIMVRR